MGVLATDLKKMGFERLEKESPIDERGTLWTDGHEVVCDQTGTVIDGDHFPDSEEASDEVYYYHNSGRVKLCGGYTGSYEWRERDGKFRY